MPRRASTLTDKQVRALRLPGLHAVGGTVPGLALQVTHTAGNDVARSWVLRTTVDGRRRALGLGSYPIVSLAEARAKAERAVRDVREGHAPVVQSKRVASPAPQLDAPTMRFEQAAQQYIEERRASWKNAKHAAQWESTLQTYAYPILGNVPVADIDKTLILQVLKPIWNDKTETAKRVKDRLKLVLGWAKAHGLREGENPAEWRDNLEHALEF